MINFDHIVQEKLKSDKYIVPKLYLRFEFCFSSLQKSYGYFIVNEAIEKIALLMRSKQIWFDLAWRPVALTLRPSPHRCLLYTSDAADE